MFYETEFYAHLESIGLKSQSIRQYRIALDHLLAFMRARGIRAADDIAEQDVLQYVKFVESEGLASQTAYQLLFRARRYFAYLEGSGRVFLSPAASVRLPKCIKSHYRAYGETEIVRAINAPDVDSPLGLRARVILELAYSSALRPGEIRRLKRSQVDFAAGVAFIEQAKGIKDRVVPVGDNALSWVRRYIDDLRPKFIKNERHDFIFVSHVTGRPLSDTGLRLAVTDAFRQVGMVPIPLYSLRATAATNLLDRGMHVVHIAALLGHANISTTQTYLHTKRRELTRVIEAAHARYGQFTEETEETHEA